MMIDADAKFIEKHFTKRLIDGFALVDTVEDICWYHVNAKGELVEGANTAHNIPLYKASDIYNAINNAPTVDAVEVVRCEKCKNWKGPWLEDQALGKCMLGKTAITDPDHYCSYGERKDK